MFSYTVQCRFDEPALAEEWVRWLGEEHLAEVCAAGALDAEVLRLDAPDEAGATCEVRYHFASREAFAAYERDHAPRLRARGLARFPPARGLVYRRSAGDVLLRRAR